MSQYEYRIHPTLPRITTPGEDTWSFSDPVYNRTSSASEHARLHEAKIKAKRREEKEAAAREMRQQEEEAAARKAAEELATRAETPVQKVSRASDHPSPVDIRRQAALREHYAARQVESRPSTPPNSGRYPHPATPGPSHPTTQRMQTPSLTATPSRPVTPGMYPHTPARRTTAPGAYPTTTTTTSRPTTPSGYTRPASRAAGQAQARMQSPVPRVATPAALNEPTNSWRDWKYDPSIRPRMRTPPTPDYPPPAYTENP